MRRQDADGHGTRPIVVKLFRKTPPTAAKTVQSETGEAPIGRGPSGKVLSLTDRSS